MNDTKQTTQATTKTTAEPTTTPEPATAVTQETTNTTSESTPTPETKLVDVEPATAAVESAPVPTATPVVPKKNHTFTIAATVLTIVALLAVWFRLETEGRVNTNLFSGVIAAQEAAALVATVNQDELHGRDLELSIEQLSQAALTQGVDPTTEPIKSDIKTQATEMLINTTLLQQAAETEGIEITDEQIAERIAELEADAGGAEILAERMREFDISDEMFRQDIETELTILALLETVFVTADVVVTEEEIVAVYERAGGGSEGAPSLDAVRVQIEAQIRQAKEQTVVDAYLDELRAAADIEIVS